MPPERNQGSSLASAASDQVRAILDAAEQAAAQVRAQADEDASRIRAQAEEEARGIRSQARSDVRALIESIRTGLSRVRADLELLEAKLSAGGADAQAAAPVDETPSRDEAPAAEAAPAASAPAGDADLEGARLVALNMALEGAERRVVDQYLSENFAVADREALLDEVYALIES